MTDTTVICVVSSTAISGGSVKVSSKIVALVDMHMKRAVSYDDWLSPLRLSGMPLGVEVTSDLKNSRMPPLRKGALFMTDLPQNVSSEFLNFVIRDETPETIWIKAGVRPVPEPCVRVPLSILSELRGQEATVEAAKRSILSIWSQSDPSKENKNVK